MLAVFVEDNQSNWDEMLPYVMMAYRSMCHVQSSTGFTPYKVLLGTEITLPVDVVMGTQNKNTQYVSDYVQKLQGYLSTVREAVKINHKRATGKQKEYFDLKVTPQRYEENEYVWLCDYQKKKGLSPKLRKKFKGPFRIHYNRLKPYLGNTEKLKPGGNNGTKGNDWNPFCSN